MLDARLFRIPKKVRNKGWRIYMNNEYFSPISDRILGLLCLNDINKRNKAIDKNVVLR